MKPSLQFLELIAHNPNKIFENYINKEINRRKNVSSIFDYVIDKNDNTSDKSSDDLSENKNKKSFMLEF